MMPCHQNANVPAGTIFVRRRSLLSAAPKHCEQPQYQPLYSEIHRYYSLIFTRRVKIELVLYKF